jgi:hypothetical protein
MAARVLPAPSPASYAERNAQPELPMEPLLLPKDKTYPGSRGFDRATQPNVGLECDSVCNLKASQANSD